MAKDKSKKQDQAPAEEPKKKKDKGVDASSRGGMVDPGSGGNFVAADTVDKLILVWPLSLEEGIVTANGTSDAIRADIAIIDEKKPAKSELIEGGLIFQKVLQGQLRGALAKGQCVLGRLILDQASKKAGQSAPYRLQTPNETERAAGQAYIDSTNPLVGA